MSNQGPTKLTELRNFCEWNEIPVVGDKRRKNTYIAAINAYHGEGEPCSEDDDILSLSFTPDLPEESEEEKLLRGEIQPGSVISDVLSKMQPGSMISEEKDDWDENKTSESSYESQPTEPEIEPTKSEPAKLSLLDHWAYYGLASVTMRVLGLSPKPTPRSSNCPIINGKLS